jgi:hypothetical protein
MISINFLLVGFDLLQYLKLAIEYLPNSKMVDAGRHNHVFVCGREADPCDSLGCEENRSLDF